MPDRSAELLALATRRILIIDGAMGTMIQGYRLGRGGLSRRAFRRLAYRHQGQQRSAGADPARGDPRDPRASICAAGADILETNTFNATTHRHGRLRDGSALGRDQPRGGPAGPRRGGRVDAKDPARPRFVAGVLGPTNRTASISPDVNDPGKRNVTYDQLVAAYTESTHALIEGGADIILIETIFDTLNAKAAAFAVDLVFEELGYSLPVMISGTITDASGRTLSGQTTEAFYHSLRHVKPVSFGLNCALGARTSCASMSRSCRASARPGQRPPQCRPAQRVRRVRSRSRVEMAEHIREWARERLSQHGRRLLRHHPDPYPRHGRRRGGHQAARPAGLPNGRLPAVRPGAPHHHGGFHVRERGGAHQRHRFGQVQAPDQGGALRRGPGCGQAAGGGRRPDHRHQHGRGDAGRRGGHGALPEPDRRPSRTSPGCR
jgi:methionine synthase I (cobalamin-dependent)